MPAVTHVASLTHTASHLPDLVELMEPHGKLGITDDHISLDAAPLRARSLSLHWKMVFSRPLFRARDMEEQHRILDSVADLVDQGLLRTTLTRTFRPINAASLREAHRLIEAGEVIGKLVVADDARDVVVPTSDDVLLTSRVRRR